MPIFSQEKARRSGLWWFLLRGISYPSGLIRLQCETVSRLRLLFLCLRPGTPNPNGFYIAERHYPYSWPNRSSCQAHQINTIGLPAPGWLSRFYAIVYIWWTWRGRTLFLNPFLNRSLRCSRYYIYLLKGLSTCLTMAILALLGLTSPTSNSSGNPASITFRLVMLFGPTVALRM